MGAVIGWQAFVIGTYQVAGGPVRLKSKVRDTVHFANKAVGGIAWDDCPVKKFQSTDRAIHFPNGFSLFLVKPVVYHLQIAVNIKRTDAQCYIFFREIAAVYNI